RCRARATVRQHPSSAPSGARQHSVADKGIGFPFMAKGRHRTVAWDKAHVIAQRPQALGDGRQQLLVIAARKIGAADRAAEQYIPHKRHLYSGMEEHDVPGCMPGAMSHPEGRLSYLHLVALREVAIRDAGLARPAKLAAILR